MIQAVPSPQPCEEKSRLLQEYQRTTELYSSAVAELARKIGIVPRQKYQRLHEAAEKARFASADARDRMERHVFQHRC